MLLKCVAISWNAWNAWNSWNSWFKHDCQLLHTQWCYRTLRDVMWWWDSVRAKAATVWSLFQTQVDCLVNAWLSDETKHFSLRISPQNPAKPQAMATKSTLLFLPATRTSWAIFSWPKAILLHKNRRLESMCNFYVLNFDLLLVATGSIALPHQW